MSSRNHWVVLYFFIASPKKGQLLNSLMGPASTSHKRETHVGFRLLKISCPRSIYSRGFLFVVLELSSWPTSVWFFSIIIIIKPNQWHTKKKPNIWWQNKKQFNSLSISKIISSCFGPSDTEKDATHDIITPGFHGSRFVDTSAETTRAVDLTRGRGRRNGRDVLTQ